MRKKLFAIFSLVLLASCSSKTNEEKALELIEPQVKANLIKPESYDFAQLQLDSCFTDNSERNPEVFDFGLKVAKFFNEYKEFSSEAERAESVMTIYASSGYHDAHFKQQEQKYKAEMEKAQRKADIAKENILKLYKDNEKLFEDLHAGKHEFIGWAAILAYRAETAGGLKTMGGALFFLNKDLTKVTHHYTEDELASVQSAGLEDIQYEFEEELKELFTDK